MPRIGSFTVSSEVTNWLNSYERISLFGLFIDVYGF
jgi:hypothetical protein